MSSMDLGPLSPSEDLSLSTRINHGSGGGQPAGDSGPWGKRTDTVPCCRSSMRERSLTELGAQRVVVDDRRLKRNELLAVVTDNDVVQVG